MSVAWATSNITAGTYRHISQVLDSPLMDSLIKYYSDCDYKVKREVVSILQNAASIGIPDVSAKLLSKGLMEIIIDVLSHFKDPRLLIYTLETLQYVIHSGECFRSTNGNGESGNPFLKQFELRGGSMLLENLQSHQNEEVFKKVSEILNKYFSTESIE
jgi:importin subunit alpha-1/8